MTPSHKRLFLDSAAALEVVRCLRIASLSGMTVCAVIHQPRASVFALFDDLILLGRTNATLGGRTVYSGPAALAAHYFETLGYRFPPKVCN
jgi:ABC-type multidrug transport system ATPase subunit